MRIRALLVRRSLGEGSARRFSWNLANDGDSHEGWTEDIQSPRVKHQILTKLGLRFHEKAQWDRLHRTFLSRLSDLETWNVLKECTPKATFSSSFLSLLIRAVGILNRVGSCPQ